MQHRPSSAPLPKHFDCVVVGGEAVGKSSFLQRACWSSFSRDYTPTLGTEYYSLVRASTQLSIWEAGGQERYATVHVQSLRRAQAIIYVFDATRSESLHALLERADGLETVARRARVRVLVATKMDLTQRPAGDPLTLMRARQRLGTHGYFETSAATGESVVQLFDKLVATLTTGVDDVSGAAAVDAEHQKFDWRIFLSRLSCGCIDGWNISRTIGRC